MLLAPCSAKLSAQSPPWSRKASPAATRASAFFRLRASPANTSGGKVASCASTSANAFASGYSGICLTGLARQLSGVHRSDMALTPEQKPLLIGSSEGPGYTQADAGPPVGFRAREQSPCGKAEFASAVMRRERPASPERTCLIQILEELHRHCERSEAIHSFFAAL